jgi:hypothetical protein
MFFFRRAAQRRSTHPSRITARPSVEALESRLAPYAATGNAWPHPQLVTISFVPDGTVLAQENGGYITSNLFASFSKIPGITSPTQWQNIILKAAQSWAAQTNINFTVVSDDGSDAGSGSYQQGASNFGDIRIGGYNFGSTSNWLASTFYPPSVNNYSVAGDVAFNTAYQFQIGSTYDLFTVAEHEIGHALGLACSSSTGAVMYSTYNGAVSGLGNDDIAGIQSIYGVRAKDANFTSSNNTSFANAANITSAINSANLTAVLNNLSITSTVNNQDAVTSADIAYYKFTAPSSSARTMIISVQSAGLSLLSPMMTVYASNGMTVLGTVSGKGHDGTTLTLNIAVTPGATYDIKVQGADNTVFSTGAYALTLNLGTGPNPTVSPPNTQTANGNPLSAGGGVPMEPATNPSPGVAGLLSPLQAIVGVATDVVGGLLGGVVGVLGGAPATSNGSSGTTQNATSGSNTSPVGSSTSSTVSSTIPSVPISDGTSSSSDTTASDTGGLLSLLGL